MSERGPNRLGKYELITRIATGGMAEIHLARQHGLGHSRRVVVKRPAKASPLGGRQPDLAISSPNTRYDVYLARGR